MDIFEVYSKEIHKDIIPDVTPTDDELFELKGNDTPDNIDNKTDTNLGMDVETLTNQINDLKDLVNKLVAEKGENNE